MSSSEDEDHFKEHQIGHRSDDDCNKSNDSLQRHRVATENDSIIGEHDENTIRIMLSTDNHLGYCEDDAVRGMDSFAALEEVLWLARHYQADMVLLAGDLFHHNKPSRGTLHKTMDLFRRYCLGDNPIQIQIISNQAQNFRNGSVNYEDENYSVDLPVFAIHGNHDDPTRDAATTDLFCALDLLDVANLVNYFGRQEKIDQVQVSPILMKKGTTHLALYGLGSMRDERLHRMWRSQQLKFLRPETPQGEDNNSSWFNLFALHQNRDFGRGTKNCIQETMIPEWMDLVCWGHEHECCIQPRESIVGTFRITQPGSSVATSLSAGEAEPKHVGILDIRGSGYRVMPIPLTQVRSFARGDINLADIEGLDPDGPKVDKEVTEVLDNHVRVLVYDAREKIKEILQGAQECGNVLATMEELPLKYTLQKPESVLVRLNVDHSGFSILNNQRFGAKFVGEVANPTDILLYSRKKSAQKKSTTKNLNQLDPIEPDQLQMMKIEDLIVGELENADQKMEVFDEKRISAALDSYVEKQEVQAIPEAMENLLSREQKKWIKKGSTLLKGDQESKTRSKTANCDASMEGADFDATDDVEPPEKRGSPAKKKRAQKVGPKNTTKRTRKVFNSSESEVSEIDDDSPLPKLKGGRTASARARRSIQPKYKEDSEDEIEEMPPTSKRSRVALSKSRLKETRKRGNYQTMSDSDDDDGIKIISGSQKKKRRRATASIARSQSTSRSSSRNNLSQSQLSFAPVQRKSHKAARGRLYLNNNDSNEDSTYAQNNSREMEDGWGTAKTDTNEA